MRGFPAAKPDDAMLGNCVARTRSLCVGFVRVDP
jgi:hypothetical protein